MDRFGASAADLMAPAAKRQYELKDPVLRDDLAAARAVLKKHSMMLLTASKASVLSQDGAGSQIQTDLCAWPLSGAGFEGHPGPHPE